MIRLGSAEIEFVPAKDGDEGWTDHWEVYERLGRRRRLHGYAVSPEGAAMLVATLAATASQRGAGARAVRDWREWLQGLAAMVRTTGPEVPKNAGQPRQETT